jgi:hypothetical protein
VVGFFFPCSPVPEFLALIHESGHQLRSALSPGESLSAASKSILDLLKLPRFVKKLFSYFTQSSDPLSSELYDMMHEKNTIEERELIAARDRYRAEWHKKWIEEGLDFVLTVPLSLPAIENGASEKTTLMVAGYTFLFSIVCFLNTLIESFLIFFFTHSTNLVARLFRWSSARHACRSEIG